jgi:hypothetical protein
MFHDQSSLSLQQKPAASCVCRMRTMSAVTESGDCNSWQALARKSVCRSGVNARGKFPWIVGLLVACCFPWIVAARGVAKDAGGSPQDSSGDQLFVVDLLSRGDMIECPPLYIADPSGELPLMGPVYSESSWPWQTGCSGCSDSGGCASCRPRWFASASGLVMTRTLPSGAPMSSRNGAVALTSANAAANWPGGLDLRIGRWFGQQQRHGVEAIYWGIYNIGTADSADGGGLDAVPSLAPTILVGAAPASTLFENASAQRVGRNDLVNDVEVNWLYTVGQHPEWLDNDHPWSLTWLAGFRFFQLLDTLTLTSPSGGSDPLILDVTANNNLFGAQVGTRLDWHFAHRFRLAAIPKFMIGGSSVSNLSTLQTADGVLATYANGDTVSGRTTGSTFGYLGSVDGLIAWDVTDHWSLWIGYRVVGVGNVFNADSVWPTQIVGPSSLAVINTGGTTLIHGGFAGFESRY